MLAQNESLLIWGCIYAYAVSTILLLTGFVFNKERLLRWATYPVIAAFLTQSAVFMIRWVRTGYFPANGNLENAVTGSWFAIAFTLYLLYRNRAMSGVALFTVPATLLLLGYGIMTEPAPLPLTASFKSSWLLIHVLFAQIAFGAFAIASGMGLIYILKDRKDRFATELYFYKKLPSLEVLEERIFRFVVYGFISEAVMIIAGAIWAKNLWGSYWAWDPVEVWSLVSWLLYGLAIHLKVTLGWKGKRFAWIILFLLATVIITYWGIDVLVQQTRHMFGVSRGG